MPITASQPVIHSSIAFEVQTRVFRSASLVGWGVCSSRRRCCRVTKNYFWNYWTHSSVLWPEICHI